MNRIPAVALLASVSVVGVLTASRQAQQPPVPTADLIIIGRIVEAGTTTGVGGALVRITGGIPLPPVVPGASPMTPTRQVVADGQGNFVFRGLTPGTYRLSSTAAGFIPGAYGQTRIVQIARGLDLVRSLELTSNERVVNVSIQMWRTGGIAGRVTDELGEPLVNIPVTILARMTDWGGPTMVTTTTTMSDDRGMYHADVVPGDYVVGVLAATTTLPVSAVQGSVETRARGGEEFQQYMSQIRERGSLLPRGYGSRVGDYVVSQFGERNAPVVPPFRSEGGKDWFYPTTFHRSSLTAPGAQLVSVTAGEEKAGVDITMRPAPAMRISGRVAGPDGPIPRLALRLAVPDPALHRVPGGFIDNAQALADDNGNFMFIGVPPGTYLLRAVMSPSTSNSSLLSAVDSITVGESDVSDVQVRLQPGGQISGRVVFEGAPIPLANLRNIAISPRPIPGTAAAFIENGALGILTITSETRPENGIPFTTRQYVPGRYMMSIAGGIPPGWVLKSITVAGQDALDRAFELGPSGVSDMVVTISNRVSTVTGLARDVDGKAVASSVVAIFPTDRGLWRLPGMQSRRMVTTAPNRDGRFTFTGLPSGEYFVVAADWPSQDFADADVLKTLIQHAQKLTLGDGERRTLDLRVVVMK